MMTGHAEYATRAERLAALTAGANIIRSRLPNSQAVCDVWIGQNRLHAHVEWRWPGVVRVTLRFSGELIAESKPGKPYELAANKKMRRA